MLRTIKLYGKLRKLCGVDQVTLSGNTAAELIEGLSANFREQLKPRIDRPRLICRIKDIDSEQGIYAPLSEDVDTIHLYPALIGAGGGNGGLFKIIVGVVLIAVSIFFFNPMVMPLLASLSAKVGVALIIGGLMQELSPVPKVDTSAANDIESSKYLGSSGNTVAAGTPIPLLMGRHKAYGQFISLNVDAKNVAI